MKRRTHLVLILVLLLLLTYGCGAKYTPLTTKQTKNINRIGIIITASNNEMSIIDHTNVMGRTYVGGQFGAIGGLLEGIVLTIQANVKIEKSLGGVLISVQ